MRYEDIDKSLARSLRRQIAVALLSSVALIAGFGGVAAYSEINGAVVGSGKFVSHGHAKLVQHPDGGIVSEIFVSEDERVSAGQLLFSLDDTRVRASLGVVEAQLRQTLVQRARLMAEMTSEPLEVPDDAAGPDVDALLASQLELMAARSATRDVRKTQLREQIAHFGLRETALATQRTSLEENVGLLEEQIAAFAELHEKGLLVDSTLSQVQRERATLAGELASLDAQDYEIQQAMTLAELQIAQIDEEFAESVLTELDLKNAEIARLREERIAALDRLSRTEIRSPINGYLHELSVHTMGGIISPGETLVSVIPTDDELVIEARLSPMDIDQVFVDQGARIRLSSLDQRVTPELFATVSDVSADLSVDQATGASYYLMRLQLPSTEIDRIEGQILRPGMPAEVFIETEARTVLSYLVKPIADQIRHAMIEN
jgi:HlyD family type I secretion membrane fusion protein